MRAIELIERSFDDPVIFRVGIDHDRIIRDIRQDPHPWQKRFPAAWAATEPGRKASRLGLRGARLGRPRAPGPARAAQSAAAQS
ncbi:MAG: hypothetical protein ACREDH_04560, partial [Methylocella sp.]